MFSQNPFLQNVLLLFGGMFFLIVLYLWKKPKRARLLFAIGWICLALKLGAEIFSEIYLVLGPHFLLLFSIGSLLAILPLPKILGNYSSGRILSAVFGIVLFFFLIYDPLFWLFRGKELARLNGVRPPGRLVINQSTEYSCVAACVASMMTDFGYPLREGEATVLLQTSKRGTYLSHVLYYLKKHPASFRVQRKKFTDVRWNEPWVSLISVLVKPVHNPNGPDIHHMVLAYPNQNGIISVGDPLQEYPKNYTQDAFEKHYRPIMVIQVQNANETIPRNPIETTIPLPNKENIPNND